MTTFEKVSVCIAGELGIPREEIKPQTRLIEIGDSLEIVALLIELENELSCEIPQDDAEKLFTVQGVVDYIDTHSVRV